MKLYEVEGVYPDVATPVTDKELVRLYKLLNEKYFENALPDCRCRKAALAKNFLGKCHQSIGKTVDYLITIAMIIENDVTMIVDTMLHEMIHVWQYEKALKTGDPKWMDEGFFDRILYKDKNERNHGKHFVMQMERLNAFGFNVEIAGDAPVGLSISRDFYGIIFHVNDDRSILLYSATDPRPIMDDKIMPQIIERMGDGFYTDMAVFKTKDSNVLQGVRITKQGNLPKNVINIMVPSDYAHNLLSSSDTTIFSGEQSAATPKETPQQNIPNDLVQLMPLIRKYRGQELCNFFKTIMMNTDIGIKNIEVNGERRVRLLPHEPIDGLDPKIQKYITDEWMGISDIEVKRSHAVKMTKSMPAWAVRTDDKKILPRDAERINRDWQEYFKPRMNADRYFTLLKQQHVSWMKSAFKKQGDTTDPTPLIDHVFSDVTLT